VEEVMDGPRCCEPPKDADKTPVTIVTGFLGAGKTTLVNHILRDDHGMKLAVIENEFGEVSIDTELVDTNLKSDETIMTMANGCVCCSVRTDLVQALELLASRPDKFDGILLETTGLADPGPVAFTFFSQPRLALNYRIDSILCLVDCKHALRHVREVKEDHAVNEAVQQIAFADRILVNKVDLVSKEEKEEVIDEIKSINSAAELIECHNSVVSLNRIFGVSSFSVENTIKVDPDFMEQDDEDEKCADKDCTDEHCTDKHCADVHCADEHCTEDHCADKHCTENHCGDEHCTKDHCHEESQHHGNKHEHNCTDEHCTDDHCHDKCHDHESADIHAHRPKKKKRKVHNLSGVGSVGVELEGDLDEEMFNDFMTEIVQNNGENIYRAKGVLAIQDREEKFVFQAVHDNIDLGAASTKWQADEKKINKLVLIGKNLDGDNIKKQFKQCLWQPLPSGWQCTTDENLGRKYYYNVETKKAQWTRPTETD